MKDERAFCKKIIFHDKERNPILGIVVNVNIVDNTITVSTRHRKVSLMREDIRAIIDTEQEFEGDLE